GRPRGLMGERIVPDDERGRAEAIRVLQGGGIVGLPTDTVYGIAVSLATPGGIERLFAAKGRSPDRAIALLLADAVQAAEIGIMDGAATALAAAFWPGGLTLVVPRRPAGTLPEVLTGGAPTIGLRVPAHAAPRALAAAVGPLPTTSANRSGEPEARTAAEIERLLGGAVDLILDGGPSAGGPASTVVDAAGARLRVLRAGAIAIAEVRRVLGEAGLPDLDDGGVPSER
ncbi:MAG TPA: L-threonylcarbamoyladenylate synthase, partial [Candidatus Eisenbacteria bacterium]|nr:L-threonylcarbamoyladenylate synthase [Candidatus Eisenbacteria bacterium]